MNTTSMSYIPKFPWNDDERDTSSYIEYYSSISKTDVDQEPERYIPTYEIMKEYYQEQEQELYCENYQSVDWYNDEWQPIQYARDAYDDADSYSQSNCDWDSFSNDGDNVVKSEDEEDAEGNASSPYVSGKYWYT